MVKMSSGASVVYLLQFRSYLRHIVFSLCQRMMGTRQHVEELLNLMSWEWDFLYEKCCYSPEYYMKVYMQRVRFQGLFPTQFLFLTLRMSHFHQEIWRAFKGGLLVRLITFTYRDCKYFCPRFRLNFNVVKYLKSLETGNIWLFFNLQTNLLYAWAPMLYECHFVIVS